MRRPVPAARLSGLVDDGRGLSPGEAEERLTRFGHNDIIEARSGGWRDVLTDTIKDPMIWFLAATSALFAAVGDYGESFIMLVAIGPLVGMDAFLHRRTQASTQGLSSRLAERATVIRNGKLQDLAVTEVVPGDLVVVPTGQSFPADGLILEGDSLQVDESALTGEAFPVRKDALRSLPQPVGNGSVDTVHWGFAGTRLLTGEARLRIVNTGAETLYGEIVRSAVQGAQSRTPLQRNIGNLVTGLLVAATALCATLAWIRWQQGHGIVDALVSAVTLAVAAIPEEFPIVFTFFLGVGIFRLARRHALVRRAVVVENIGRVTCICSDKTGTLTEGQIHVGHCIPAGGVDTGKLLEIAALASRSDSGDALDRAILQASGPRPTEPERIATFPFTEDRRRESGIFRTSDATILVATKGAPETILQLCVLSGADLDHWKDRIQQLAETGHKVIACACLEFTGDNWPDGEPDSGFSFAGLLACEDPVREGVTEAVHEARNAGIRVILITGDHAATAIAVAREVGIGGSLVHAIDGDELEGTIASPDAAALRRVDVIARAMPAQKLALVRALQSQGEVVAVTGDGVNDVPALQAADIGIAMGERGTRSAREVGSIVLLDDNFRTIVSAIREGRQLFRNLRLSFAYLLMIHIPLVATATLIPLAGYPLLYLPIHIVWLELIIHPTALLVFQGLPAETRLRPAGRRERKGVFFTMREWLLIGAVGIIITLLIVWGYVRSLGTGPDVEHARAMALVALVITSSTLTACLSGLRTRASWITTIAATASAIILVQVPLLASAVHLESLHADDWIIATIFGLVPGLLTLFLRWKEQSETDP